MVFRLEASTVQVQFRKVQKLISIQKRRSAQSVVDQIRAYQLLEKKHRSSQSVRDQNRSNNLEQVQLLEQFRSQDQLSALSLSVFRSELTVYQVIFKSRSRSYQKSQDTIWTSIYEDPVME
ncbi:trihelix transcription factor GT-2 [Dorcoceras hygrometricum]|uniref:Trihelix transcription factor GT-2 n=1 Tax=Dorcoceras hygrometricum TaxID=472368 RepID=A0A2Z7AUN9_9LAMI|nr:trihelix transcription factor GT-2 [Dorcoceras hygrometricum]